MSNRRVPLMLALFALLATFTGAACGGSSSPTCTPMAEICNGRDDDCDTQVDEGFDVGAACTVGVGACQASGVVICAASGAGAVCSAAPGDPTAESCNQVDDDCDGQVDQGLAGCCVPATTRACGVEVGACRAGLETCSGTGAWGACLLDGQPVVLPGSQAETCDGLDDDCDGQTDEADAGGCATSYADQDQDGFGAGPGACLCAPAAPFTASEAGDCDDAAAAVRPGAAETCNGRDDDCDTLVDEGFDVGATCSAGSGACAMSGVLACAAGGAATTCTAVPGTPSAEACNGVDDDCDGLVDEEGAAGCTMFYEDQDRDGHGGGAGACLCAAAPPYTTPATGGLDCDDAVAAVHPGATEVCNGRDDDCDGATDESDPALGQACDGPDADLCAEGVVACASGQLQCTDTTAGNVETCNGVDDDCDGQTDEGLGLGQACSVGVGACARAGSATCHPSDGSVICGATAGTPGPEICNGVDDDCDGQTDEDDPALGQACDGADADQCAEGVVVCASGQLQCSDATGTSVETCNGVDDDCDGSTDEGFPLLGTACSAGIGACQRPGAMVCRVDGSGTICGAIAGTASPEACNGVDDDCDGSTDEDFPVGQTCMAGIGACAVPGSYFCQADGLGVTCAGTPLPPQAEQCNGLDDDCDGTTDENPVSQACAKQSGVCAGALGTADLCQGGSWLACTDATYAAHAAAYQPSETACDGLDNDCDGTTDEACP